MRFKKTITLVLLLTIIFFSVVTSKAENLKEAYYNRVVQDVFYTYNTYQISVHDPKIDQEKANLYLDEVEDLTIKISHLTDNFKDFKDLTIIDYEILEYNNSNNEYKAAMNAFFDSLINLRLYRLPKIVQGNKYEENSVLNLLTDLNLYFRNNEEPFSDDAGRATITKIKEEDHLSTYEVTKVANYDKDNKALLSFRITLDTKTLNNVNYINKNVGEKIEIDKILYDILLLSEEYYEYTDGYFDISIGKIIDEWKEIINIGSNLSKEDFEQRKELISQIPIIENGIELINEDDKYFVRISQGVKIDLGAIAKGYSVEMVDEYFKEKELTYYKILGSNSSLKYGKNLYRDENFYWIGLTSPFTNNFGYVKVKDASVTTSGDTWQQEIIHGELVHHLISPKTKKPENNYRLLTIVHSSATLSDALTTALFAMDEETLKEFTNRNNISEYIVFKTDETIIDEFKEFELVYYKNEDDPVKATLTDWIILSVVVVFIAGGLYIIANKKK